MILMKMMPDSKLSDFTKAQDRFFVKVYFLYRRTAVYFLLIWEYQRTSILQPFFSALNNIILTFASQSMKMISISRQDQNRPTPL